jgi:hypothetical protein
MLFVILDCSRDIRRSLQKHMLIRNLAAVAATALCSSVAASTRYARRGGYTLWLISNC